MLNKIRASSMVPSIVETVWLTRLGFPLGCLPSFRRHLRRHFSKRDKMITGTFIRVTSTSVGLSLDYGAPEHKSNFYQQALAHC